MTSVPSTPASHTPADTFITTRWTRVLAARGDSPEARQALSDLCAAYYAPVVAFLRRQRQDEDAARELAHEFFARVLERQSFGGADPERGRFRSYLLGALKHFLANRHVHAQREKRGGGAPHETLAGATDTSPGPAIADPSTPSPDAVFDREWAVSVLERAFAILSREAEQAGTQREFETLKPWLTGVSRGRTHADAARQLGMNEGAVRVAVHRLRRRFRETVKAEIAQTVNEPSEVADELRHLIQVLS
ncbi:MAG: sigma-70 family RNA polymerase sigma factor [Verrucomicrobia bacterium]|nr:sigma-70 family RNA polymerase sigma factor [Verrucomicrobiota bacterium]